MDGGTQPWLLPQLPREVFILLLLCRLSPHVPPALYSRFPRSECATHASFDSTIAKPQHIPDSLVSEVLQHACQGVVPLQSETFLPDLEECPEVLEGHTSGYVSLENIIVQPFHTNCKVQQNYSVKSPSASAWLALRLFSFDSLGGS